MRGGYKQSEYGKVILPLTVLARLDAVLTPIRQQVAAEEKAKYVAAKSWTGGSLGTT